MKSPSGEVRDHYFPRGSKPQHQPAQQRVMKEDQVKCKEQQMVMTEEAGTWMARATESWHRICPELLKVAIASEAMPDNQQCLLCSIEDACCRCLQCGPNMYFCRTVLWLPTDK